MYRFVSLVDKSEPGAIATGSNSKVGLELYDPYLMPACQDTRSLSPPGHICRPPTGHSVASGPNETRQLFVQSRPAAGAPKAHVNFKVQSSKIVFTLHLT